MVNFNSSIDVSICWNNLNRLTSNIFIQISNDLWGTFLSYEKKKNIQLAYCNMICSKYIKCHNINNQFMRQNCKKTCINFSKEFVLAGKFDFRILCFLDISSHSKSFDNKIENNMYVCLCIYFYNFKNIWWSWIRTLDDWSFPRPSDEPFLHK